MLPIDRSFDGTGRQTLDEILDWESGLIEALREQHIGVMRDLTTGSTIAPRFALMLGSEIDKYFDDHRREVELMTILKLVASVEASIRDDFTRRLTSRKKDSLTTAYLELQKKSLKSMRKRRVNFDGGDGLLLAMRTAGFADSHVINQFRVCLHLRHWIGHGRYWVRPVVADQLDSHDVYERCRKLLAVLG